MNNWRYTVAAIVMTLGCAPIVSAATLTVSGGSLTGATGVNVGGTFYDVAFLDGTCAAIFDGCDDPLADFTFPTQTTAVAASQALLDQVLLDGPLGNFDSNTNLTFGCGGTDICQVLTPFLVVGTNMSAGDAINFSAAFGNADEAGAIGTLNADLSETGAKVFARWTASPVTAVPEPTSLTLLGAGLASLSGRAWRARRRRRHP